MLFLLRDKNGIGSIFMLTFWMKALLYKRGTGTRNIRGEEYGFRL